MENLPIIIVEMGAYETIIGYANSENFAQKMPTIVADSGISLISKPFISNLSKMARERFYGASALRFKNVLKIEYILRQNDYKSFAILLQNAFEELFIDSLDVNIALVIPSTLLGIDRERLQFELFSLLHSPRITFLPSSVCALTALGIRSGVVVDIGYFDTRIESIFKGFPNQESQFKIAVGGAAITQRLIDLMFQRLQFQVSLPLQWIAEDIKRAVIFCEMHPTDVIEEIQQGSNEYDQLIELPDGKQFTINRERFECVEPLFNPELIHVRDENIITYIEKSIRAWERAQVPELVQNIIICGNGASIPGLIERIEVLLQDKFPASLEIGVPHIEENKTLMWFGAQKIILQRKGQMEWIENPELQGGEGNGCQ